MYFQQISKTILVASSMSLVSWTVALAQSPQEKIVENWVSSANDSAFVTVSLEDIVHNSGSDITTVKNLSIQFKFSSAKSSVTSGTVTAEAKGKLEYVISFPSIEFASLAFDNGYYSAKSIKAEVAQLKFDIVGNDPAASSSATGTYDDFLINNMRWASLPELVDDPEKPISKYYPIIKALVDISFDDAFLGGMTMKQVMGDKGINTQISYGSTKVGKTVSGNFSNMLLSGMKMSILAPEGSSPEVAKSINSEVAFGDISVSDYNYGTFVRNFEPGKTSADDAPYDLVFGDMTMRNMRISNAGGNFSLDKFSIREFGSRAPKVSVLDVADQLFVQQKATGEKPDPKKLVELFGVFMVLSD